MVLAVVAIGGPRLRDANRLLCSGLRVVACGLEVGLLLGVRLRAVVGLRLVRGLFLVAHEPSPIWMR